MSVIFMKRASFLKKTKGVHPEGVKFIKYGGGGIREIFPFIFGCGGGGRGNAG